MGDGETIAERKARELREAAEREARLKEIQDIQARGVRIDFQWKYKAIVRLFQDKLDDFRLPDCIKIAELCEICPMTSMCL